MVTVYITPGRCPNCTATKKALDRRGVTYSVEVMTDAQREEFKIAGYLAAPVVVTENDSWAGFRPDKLIGL